MHRHFLHPTVLSILEPEPSWLPLLCVFLPLHSHAQHKCSEHSPVQTGARASPGPHTTWGLHVCRDAVLHPLAPLYVWVKHVPCQAEKGWGSRYECQGACLRVLMV